MSQAMSLGDTSLEGNTALVVEMLNAVGIRRLLSEIGVPADCAQRIAEKAIQDSAAGTNPRAASVAEIKMLIETAIAQAR